MSATGNTLASVAESIDDLTQVVNDLCAVVQLQYLEGPGLPTSLAERQERLRQAMS